MMDSGIAGKIQQFIELTGGFGIVVAVLALLIVFILIVSRQYRLTINCVLMAMLFSLFAEPFHTFFDMVRWGLILILVPLGVTAIGQGRMSYWLMVSYWLIGAIFSIRSSNLVWSLTSSLLTFSTIIGFGGTLLRLLQSPADIARLFRYISWLAVVFTVVNGIAIIFGFSEGSRISGAAVREGSLALAGGALLPFVFWRALISTRTVPRIAWIVCGAALASEIVISTQRTGMLLGAISSIYLLFTLKREMRLRTFIIISIALGLFLAIVMATGEQHVEYISARLQGTADSGRMLSGRLEIWEKGWDMCMEQPLLGRGFGSDSTDAAYYIGKSFHNAYLGIWYNAGLFGLLCFIFSILSSIWGSRLALRRITDPQLNMTTRVIIGLLIGLFAAGVFERSIAGGANLFVALVLLCIVCSERIKQWAHWSSYA